MKLSIKVLFYKRINKDNKVKVRIVQIVCKINKSITYRINNSTIITKILYKETHQQHFLRKIKKYKI